MPTPAEIHRVFFGTDPTPTQQRLYQSGRRGVAAPIGDDSIAKATLVVAMADTFPVKGVLPSKVRAAVLTPTGGEAFAIEEARLLVRQVLRRAKLSERDSVRMMLRFLIDRLYVGSAVPTSAPPGPWVAIGLQRDATLPSWVQAGIIDP